MCSATILRVSSSYYTINNFTLSPSLWVQPIFKICYWLYSYVFVVYRFAWPKKVTTLHKSPYSLTISKWFHTLSCTYYWDQLCIQLYRKKSIIYTHWKYIYPKKKSNISEDKTSHPDIIWKTIFDTYYYHIKENIYFAFPLGFVSCTCT